MALMDRFAVVGIGYVGSPLAAEAAGAGLSVSGLDIDLRAVEAMNAGESGIEPLSDELLRHIACPNISAETEVTGLGEDLFALRQWWSSTGGIRDYRVFRSSAVSLSRQQISRSI